MSTSSWLTPQAPTTGGAPEKRHLRVGFVALSDAAPLIVAKRLELGHEHGLTLELSRESSWAAIRDKLLTGELDAAHSLYGLVYGVQLGIGGPREAMAVLMVLNRNGQAITVTPSLADAMAQTGDVRSALASLGRKPVFAQTFPTGTHAMFLNYWFAAQGVDPLTEISRIVIPPAHMVAAMDEGGLDGFCCGEPWHAVAQARGLGRTVVVSSDIWPNHPEKVLACRHDFVTRYPRTAQALVRTLLSACRWLDMPGHRAEAAGWLAEPAWVGAPRDLIAARLLGDFGRLPGRHALLPVSFFDDGAVNYPHPLDGIWFIAQYRRWAMVGDEALAQAAQTAAAINQTALFESAARAEGLPAAATPAGDVLCDGRVWAPGSVHDLRAYVDGYAIRAP
ncbi:ABC transporter substrate-binding protein [Pandoraea nosoerga]|uniref:Nitrate ABC transporter substrate-binding protein n=1 Tax=Pandoraea nosoerga TaxID=2508296 RepID=A0A5E4WC18_9BURK|nr:MULTISPECIES: CmpA/NrtA family ABC transporter substrate-binding protein [Pandoraea]MBN4665940.1 ABC transporter substrate-binding protein [Pandoraea nosoerga]MBN4676114.1 ABC transporter substrate-binding protein [Pandoraea nosoerga]MBN4682477.1 ABC transporter substrate-binding protein [Pandoraea nosoerga]MBN4745018.1 ABC transporter substrate-binding protein [Pandoraea nosoerga]VVE22312.1 nitrate ABC transporter substrate-binding protein [Pandoraea nosoerga]